MTASDIAPEMTVWTDPANAARCGQVVTQLGAAVRVIGVGGPRAAEIDQLARRLDCPCEDDLRKLLIDCPAAFLLLAANLPIAPAHLQIALSQETLVLALEPALGSLEELTQLRRGLMTGGNGKRLPSDHSLRLIHVPAFSACPGWTHAAEPHEVLGQVFSLCYTSVGNPTEGSLPARLFDAWQTILSLGDLPESIDASLTGPLLRVPQDLRSVEGHLHAHARLAHGRSALLLVSDRAAYSQRSLYVLAEQAQLRVSDLAYTLYDPRGNPLDQHQSTVAQADWTDLTVRQIRRVLDCSPAAPPPDKTGGLEEALACSLTCLLSCRTGQPENPRRLLEMHGG